MTWHHPPFVKLYEALGAVADGRVEVSGNTGKVYSSSRGKYYDITYDPVTHEIMSNDNGSYWKGYLGYPAVAYLMTIGVVSYDPHMGELLKNIPWKDINQKFKNDFDAALEFILQSKSEIERKELKEFLEKIDKEIKTLNLGMLGEKQKPPAGY